jgi:hypothetical protein
MSAVDDNIAYWRNIATQLRRQYYDRYFHHQPYIKDHFLEPVVPFQESFFGTKTFHILIVSKPYEWNAEFQAYTDELTAIIRRNYGKFPFYLVDIYVDYLLAERTLARYDNTGYIAKLDAMAPHIETMCNEMIDFGFRYRGPIKGDSGQPAFYSSIPDFYNLRES